MSRCSPQHPLLLNKHLNPLCVSLSLAFLLLCHLNTLIVIATAVSPLRAHMPTRIQHSYPLLLLDSSKLQQSVDKKRQQPCCGWRPPDPPPPSGSQGPLPPLWLALMNDDAGGWLLVDDDVPNTTLCATYWQQRPSVKTTLRASFSFGRCGRGLEAGQSDTIVGAADADDGFLLAFHALQTQSPT